jgi:hypothetical protein
MRRREFLVKTSLSAISSAFYSAVSTAQTRTALDVRRIILSLEREIRALMGETLTPGARSRLSVTENCTSDGDSESNAPDQTNVWITRRFSRQARSARLSSLMP